MSKYMILGWINEKARVNRNFYYKQLICLCLISNNYTIDLLALKLLNYGRAVTNSDAVYMIKYQISKS